MNKECPYCVQNIVYVNGLEFSRHCANCKSRPNYWNGVKKCGLKHIKRKKYLFHCKKCNKIYTLILAPHDYNNNSYRKHCSRKCANSRIATPHSKQKAHTSMIEYLKKQNKYCVTQCKFIICVICHKKKFIKKSLHSKTCSKECHSKLMSHVLFGKCGGLTSHKTYKYTMLNNTIIHLQSSYELKLAKILDDNKIEWERPKFVWWIDKDNKKHRYFPDFILTKYNIYIDTKNDYLAEKDKYKIEQAMKQNNILIYILKFEHISIEYIKQLINGCVA